jgi:DNA methylase
VVDEVKELYCKQSETMEELADNSIDSLVTDPPAGISFMGKAWDGDKGGRLEWIAWLAGTMREALRVLKPGAHGFVWALPRTSHWTMMALEEAGFEVRDVVTHLYGTGFPKSLDVSKALDKAAGVKPIGSRKATLGTANNPQWNALENQLIMPAATTDDAKAWVGWGTALKPAAEFWILVRKPISERSVAANVIKHGVGGINIDASRIEYLGDQPSQEEWNRMGSSGAAGANGFAGQFSQGMKDAYAEGKIRVPSGRWPANLILSHNPDCVQTGTRVIPGDPEPRQGGGAREGGFYDVGSESGDGKPVGPIYGDVEVPVYACTPDCAVAALDAQSGVLKSGDNAFVRATATGYSSDSFGTHYREEGSQVLTYGDVGFASRFFWVPKPAGSEKNANVESGNHHPTVKPLDLMCYLIRMITPAGGTVLDCFAGSGTTLVAAESMGYGWVGYEREPEYVAIANARLSQRGLF